MKDIWHFWQLYDFMNHWSIDSEYGVLRMTRKTLQKEKKLQDLESAL